MHTGELTDTLTTLFAELVDGPPDGAFMLNSGDPGLLRSLDRLTPAAASAVAAGGSSIAAHAEHLRYGLSLMNRWSAGEEPFAGADWTAAWRRTTVSDAEWKQLRAQLRDEAHRWLGTLRTPREADQRDLNGIMGSIAHVAYHLGAIRQIDQTTRGPKADE
jgi:hypothetical protein